MNKDRTKIYEIISQLLDSSDPSGIPPASTTCIALEHYIEQERYVAIGWMHAEACAILDRGSDPRTEEVPGIIERARAALSR